MASPKEIAPVASTEVKVRASVSLPQPLHKELEKLARDKRVSLAWVIRDAAEKYIVAQGRMSSGPL